MMNWIVPVLLGFVALTAFWAIGCYNRLQALRAAALQALAQHAASLASRNVVISAICDAMFSNLQHERATITAVQAAVHRNNALAEAASLSRGAAESLAAFAQSEHELMQHVRTLNEISAAYPELVVNAQLTAGWQALSGAFARSRFSLEQFNANAHALNAALQISPAHWLAQSMKLRRINALPLEMGDDVAVSIHSAQDLQATLI